jgi:dihydroorotase-like cyclic amidohydrolase
MPLPNNEYHWVGVRGQVAIAAERRVVELSLDTGPDCAVVHVDPKQALELSVRLALAAKSQMTDAEFEREFEALRIDGPVSLTTAQEKPQ